MKIDKLVRYCDRDLKEYALKRVCRDCNHGIKYPGNCGECIDQSSLVKRNE